MRWLERFLLWLLNPYKKSYTFEHHTCAGQEIRCHNIGNKKGKKLVCVPGLLGLAPYFYILLRPMLLRKYNVIILENYYGDVSFRKGKSDNEYMLQLYEVFADFMKQLDADDVYLLGNSLGTIWIKKYAIENPEKVSKIICLGDSGLSKHYELDEFDLNKGKADKGNKASVKSSIMLQLKLVRMIVNKWWKMPFGTMLWYRQKLAANPAYLRRIFIIAAATKQYDMSDLLPNIKCDVVLIHGNYDKIVNIKIRDVYEKAVKRLKFYKLPVGHEVLNEQPKDVTKIIYKELGLSAA